MTVPAFDTMILAGGAGSRLDGADKPALEVAGQPMLVSVAAAAAAAGSGRLIVVGPARSGAVGRGIAAAAAGLSGGLITVRESPPGAGPVPALRRGLTEIRAPLVALLAADLPFLTETWVSALVAAASSAGADGAVLADASGRPQWLAGCWRTAALTAALDGYRGQSLGGLLGPLDPAVLASSDESHPPWLDCDDPESLAAARAAHQDGGV